MTNGYTGPKLTPKKYPSPNKDVPVLRDKAPKGSKKVPIRYGKSRAITYAEQYSVEQQRKRASVGGIKDDPSNTAGEKKEPRKGISKIRKAFGRVSLRAMVLGGGGGGGAGRK